MVYYSLNAKLITYFLPLIFIDRKFPSPGFAFIIPSIRHFLVHGDPPERLKVLYHTTPTGPNLQLRTCYFLPQTNVKKKIGGGRKDHLEGEKPPCESFPFSPVPGFPPIDRCPSPAFPMTIRPIRPLPIPSTKFEAFPMFDLLSISVDSMIITE
jgi:hypothetical protein